MFYDRFLGAPVLWCPPHDDFNVAAVRCGSLIIAWQSSASTGGTVFDRDPMLWTITTQTIFSVFAKCTVRSSVVGFTTSEVV